MATLIVSLLSVKDEWSTLTAEEVQLLTAWVGELPEEARPGALQRVKGRLSYRPWTATVAVLGVYDVERGVGTVYDTSPRSGEETRAAFTYRSGSEATMLADFWEGVQHYDRIVTYGGQSFLLPFLLHRSAAHGVVPTRDLLRYRYLTQQVPPYHIDLQDEFTFHGVLGRRVPLPLLCRLYALPCPVLTPAVVDAAWQAGEQASLAEKLAGELAATAALYEVWRTYFAPTLFRVAEEEVFE